MIFHECFSPHFSATSAWCSACNATPRCTGLFARRRCRVVKRAKTLTVALSPPLYSPSPSLRNTRKGDGEKRAGRRARAALRTIQGHGTRCEQDGETAAVQGRKPKCKGRAYRDALRAAFPSRLCGQAQISSAWRTEETRSASRDSHSILVLSPSLHHPLFHAPTARPLGTGALRRPPLELVRAGLTHAPRGGPVDGE